MSALLASDRISTLEGDLGVTVTAEVVDGGRNVHGAAEGVARGRLGWDLVAFAGGHFVWFGSFPGGRD